MNAPPEAAAGDASIASGRVEAMAEVAAMEGPTNARRTAGQEAVMGATADGIAGFEVTDESAELVMQRFVQFLRE
jgi:hypothetical protein